MKIRGHRRLAVLIPIAVGGLVVAGIGVAGKAKIAGKPAPTPPKVVKHDTSPPLKTIKPKPVKGGQNSRMEHKIPVPKGSASADPVVQAKSVAANGPNLLSSFEGVAVQDSAPPDPNGAVGPADYVQVVNESFQVFTKKGTSLYGPVPTNTLWSGFGTDCEAQNDGDATVSYDRQANRWVFQQFAVSGSQYLECIAVSTSGDPTGSYNRYAFSGFGSEFPDYPKLGVWPDAYYVTYNLFAGGQFFDGPEVCAYNRAKMLSGESAETGDGMVQCQVIDSQTVGGLLPSDLDGPTAPPAGSPNFIMGFDTGTLLLWRYHVDWAQPAQTSLTGPIDIPVAAFNPACGGGTCIPQPRFNQQLDSLGDRLMYRLAYRNFGDHESMTVGHAVTAGSTVGMRWYELRDPNGTPTVYQQGTYAPADGKYRWMGSLAMNGAGGIALGFSESSASLKPSIAYTGRVASDPLGEMTQGEGILQAGGGSQGCCLERWGDYSSMSIDPADDCTFWYTNEYLPGDGTFNWHTRIGSFTLPGCTPAVIDDFSLAPSAPAATVEQGSSGQIPLTTAVTAGSAQTVVLTANNLPYDTTATFTPASIQSGDPSSVSFDVGTDTPPGSYTISLVGSGQTSTQAAKVTLTVTLKNEVVNGRFDDGLAGWTTAGTVTPTIVTAKKQVHSPGAAALIGSTTAIAGDSTLSQQVTIPAGRSRLSFVYQPACKGKAPSNLIQMQIRDTGGATLASLVSACTSKGKWLPVVVDTTPWAGQDVVLWFDALGSGLKKTSTSFLLDDVQVSRPVGENAIQNGGFEPDLSSWETGGVVTPVSGPGRTSGGNSAKLGSDVAFDGASSLTQTIVIPGGAPLLTFWYQPHCSDELAYDQIQVLVKSMTGTTTLTALNACSNNGKWTQVKVPLLDYAGRQVKLVLNVNDDDNPNDPTWALFDDLSLT